MAKLLDCACLFWRFGCNDMSLRARNHSTLADEKGAEGTAALHDASARFAQPRKWRSFWTAPVFSGALAAMICHCARETIAPSRMKKGQKGQPHSTTLARGLRSRGNGEAFGLRLSFLALWLQ